MTRLDHFENVFWTLIVVVRHVLRDDLTVKDLAGANDTVGEESVHVPVNMHGPSNHNVTVYEEQGLRIQGVVERDLSPIRVALQDVTPRSRQLSLFRQLDHKTETTCSPARGDRCVGDCRCGRCDDLVSDTREDTCADELVAIAFNSACNIFENALIIGNDRQWTASRLVICSSIRQQDAFDVKLGVRGVERRKCHHVEILLIEKLP